jgi:hypothetical protein
MNRDQIDEWLLACLQSSPTPDGVGGVALPAEEDWEELLRQSDRHKVTPLLYHHLRTCRPDLPVPDGITGKLRQAHLDNSARNLRLYSHLGKVLRLLRLENIPVIVLKGAYLAEFVYAHHALRFMNDLDLLVHENDLMKVDALLLEMGCTPTDYHRTVDGDCEFVYIMPKRDVCLEIHWSILPPQFPFPIDTDGQWGRSRPVIIAGVEAAAFCPEDLLVHLCLHASCKHGFEPGLRLFNDIIEILRQHEMDIDWSLVHRLTREWDVGKSVYLTLKLAMELLGARLPERFLEDLRPGDFDEQFVVLAKDQIFSRRPQTTRRQLSTTPVVAQFWGTSRFQDKVTLFWKRLFIPRKTMARLYPAPSDSLRIYFYYVVRLRNLLRTYGRDVWLWLRSDREMLDYAQEGRDLTTLKDWLSHPVTSADNKKI